MALDNLNPNATVDITDVFKAKELTSFRKELLASNRQRAVEIIQLTLPANITRIRALISASQSDSDHPLHASQVSKGPYLKAELVRSATEDETAETDVHGTGRRFLDHLASNENQRAVIKIMERESQELHFLAQELRTWLGLEVPVIEDGNSFGTEVQEHVLDALSDASKQGNNIKASQREHHNDRQKLATAWVANPNIEDHSYSIASSDRLDHFLARSHLNSILRVYMTLLHKMATNWAKITEPKGQNNNGGMY